MDMNFPEIIRINKILTGRGWKNRHGYWFSLLLFVAVNTMYTIFFIFGMLEGRTADGALNLFPSIVVLLIISDYFLVAVKIIKNFDLRLAHFLLFPTAPAEKILLSYFILIFDPKTFVYCIPMVGFIIYFALKGLVLSIVLSFFLILLLLIAVNFALGILTAVLGQTLRTYKPASIMGFWIFYLGYRIFPNIVTVVPPISTMQQGLLALFSGDLNHALRQVLLLSCFTLILFVLFCGMVIFNIQDRPGEY